MHATQLIVYLLGLSIATAAFPCWAWWGFGAVMGANHRLRNADPRTSGRLVAAVTFAVVGVLAAPLVTAVVIVPPLSFASRPAVQALLSFTIAIILLMTLTRLLYRQTSSRPDKPRVCTLPGAVGAYVLASVLLGYGATLS